jgi:hypothetical protein
MVKLLPHVVPLVAVVEAPFVFATPLEKPELSPLPLGAPVVGDTPEDVPLTTPAPPTKVLPEAAPMVTPARLLPLTVARLV